MAITTENGIRTAVKQISSVRVLMHAYQHYQHQISRHERSLLYELLGVLEETKALTLHNIRAVDETRWE